MVICQATARTDVSTLTKSETLLKNTLPNDSSVTCFGNRPGSTGRDDDFVTPAGQVFSTVDGIVHSEDTHHDLEDWDKEEDDDHRAGEL